MNHINNNAKSLRISYWNARSINKRKYELPQLLKNIDIFLCVESWLKDTPGNTSNRQHVSTLAPGFVQLLVIWDRSRNGGGILMVRKSIAFQEIPIDSPDYSVEICKFRLTNTIPSIDIIVCYRHLGSFNINGIL